MSSTLEKRAAVYEEVELGTRTVQEPETVSATVRREELTVKDEGGALTEPHRPDDKTPPKL